jgi:hypothetical protein
MEFIPGIHTAPHEDIFDISMPWYNGKPAPWLKPQKYKPDKLNGQALARRCHYQNTNPNHSLGLCWKKAIGFAQLEVEGTDGIYPNARTRTKLIPICADHKITLASPRE